MNTPFLRYMFRDTQNRLRANFEVTGKVNNTGYRKALKKIADELGVVGWCKKVNRRTIVGEVQGTDDEIKIIKNWLIYQGSHESRPENTRISGELHIPELTYEEFVIQE